jgi:DNA-binding transcriptional MocR family regulator
MTLSQAAQHYQESAIRRVGALSGSIPGLISLAAGYPAPEVFPWEDLQSITAQILARRDGNTLQYGATRGYRPLIEHLVANTLHAASPRDSKTSSSPAARSRDSTWSDAC